MNTIPIGRKIRQQYDKPASLLMILMLIGCGSFRKVEKQQSESLQEQRVEITRDSLQIDDQRSIRLLLLGKADSSASGYVMEIWPKGKFRISGAGGFEGEAEKVKLQGRLVSTNKYFELDRQDDAHSAVKSLNLTVKEESKSQHKQLLLKKNPAWMHALWLLALAIGINLAIHYRNKFGLMKQRLP
jgi:hypothetical protein